MKLSEAQRRRLSMAPSDWQRMPMFGDSRSNAPLVRIGAIEVRQQDMTPKNWQMPGVRVVEIEWRITPAGRKALKTEGEE
jgi:hypothetical protein